MTNRVVFILYFRGNRVFTTATAKSFAEAIELAALAGYDPAQLCRGERTDPGDLGVMGLAEEIERSENEVQ